MKHEEIWAGPWIRWQPKLACLHRGWHVAPALTRRLSTRPNVQCRMGRARWPSTESLSKALTAAGANLEVFAHLVSGGRTVRAAQGPARRIPLIGMAQAGGEGFFSDGGYPAGAGMGRSRFTGHRRRACLRARNFRRFHGGLSSATATWLSFRRKRRSAGAIEWLFAH